MTKTTTTRPVGNDSLQATIPKFLYKDKDRIKSVKWTRLKNGKIIVELKGDK